MQMDDMIMVSIDDHIIEPADMFEGRMPEAHWATRRRAYVATDDPRGYWEFQGQPTGHAGLNAVASWPHEEWGMDPIAIPRCVPAPTTSSCAPAIWTPTACSRRCASRTMAGFNGMSLAWFDRRQRPLRRS